jgi:hypothetical protein
MTEWRAVPGWEGYFEVSDDGRVRSLDRTVPHPTSGSRRLRGRELKQAESGPMRYRYVTLTRSGERRNKYVHTLVLEAFVGPRPEGAEACHGPAGRYVNTPENLRWDTKKANAQDSVARDKTHHEVRKTRCKRGHRLVAPNLVESPSMIARGARKCLACQVGYTQARARIPEEWWQEESDTFYDTLGMEATRGLSPGTLTAVTTSDGDA